MAKCLHISANQFPSLDKVNFTKKIWIELSKDFEEYHVIGRSCENKFQHYTEGNIHLHLVPKLGNRERSFVFSSFYIFYLINKFRITHLLAQSSVLGGFTAALASKFFKIPLMVEVHGEQYFRYFSSGGFANMVLASMSKFSFKTAVKVRSLNHFMTKKLNEIGVENISEIPNRVDLTIFNKQKSNFCLSDTINLISVGRFVPEKNYLKLIDLLSKSNFKFHLTLIGGGPLQSDYEDYIRQSGINNMVTLINWIKQEKLIELIINSDIYIQYSSSEGMPRTIVEAMALKMPIISTNIGSIPGVLEHYRNAILINPDNAIELYQSINELITKESLRFQLSNNAFQDAVQKYEWNKSFNIYRSELITMQNL